MNDKFQTALILKARNTKKNTKRNSIETGRKPVIA